MNYLEILAAVLSFSFFKGTKFLIGNLYTLYLVRNSGLASRWRVLSEENLRSPLSLPVLMTKGPRWNTHAIIGTLGPFAVRESLAVHLPTLKNSARSWILVIYGFPVYETIAALDSNDIDSSDEWLEIPLEMGRYSIGLRYYDRTPPIVFPGIKTDARTLADSLVVVADNNDFYSRLSERRNWFYLALHYYIFTLLRYRKYLGEEFVRREYLPVGAPDTEFIYDLLTRGRSLKIEVEPAIQKDFYVFLTLYDRSSFPVASCQVAEGEYTSGAMENDGYFLIRLRPRSRVSQGQLSYWIASYEPSEKKLLIQYKDS